MRLIVLILLMFTTISLWSQELSFVFKGAVENSDVGRNEAGVSIAVVQNGSTLFSSSSASNGKYSLKGAINYTTPFHVVFTKAGLVSKKVHFDLSKMNEEDAPPGDFRPVEELNMTMFKERENIDFSFLDTQPVASFDWNTRGLSVRLDQVSSNNVRNKISDLLNKAEKDAAENEAKYLAAVQKADQLYTEEDWEKSLEKYEEALMYKPKEQHPADRIVELDAKIQAMKQAELAEEQENAEYNNLIKAADNLRDQGNLQSAIDKYEEALEKKEDDYPLDQIDKLMKQIKEAENQAAYDAAIGQADGFLKQNSLKAARDRYTDASKLKPSEQYPKTKLAEIEKLLNAASEKEELQKKYNEAVAAADALFDQENYEGAKEKYNEALAIESASTYVKGRITICDEKLAAAQAEKERLEKIQALLDKGNGEMTNSEWEAAKGTFTEVLGLEATNEEAIEKLALAEQKIKEAGDLAAQEAQYAKLIQEGDKEDGAGNLDPALAKYQEAKGIKSTPEVDEKIAAVKQKIADRDALADKEGQYDKHMSEGESFLGIIGDLDGAKAEFEAALALFPDRELPKQKIKEIDDLLAAQQDAKAKREAYDAAIAEANTLFDGGKLKDSKEKYNEALGIDNTQTYPVERIAEIDGLLAEQADEQAKKDAYDAAIAEANSLFDGGKLEDSKAKYNAALAIDGTQTYPVERIAEIDGLLANQADAEAKKEAYDAAIAQANTLFDSGDLEASKAKYNDALGIDGTQSYPVERIAEIEGLLASQADAEAKKEAYDAKIAEANSLFDGGQLEDSKKKYEDALTIDGSQSYPVERIAEIDGLLAAKADEAAREDAYNAAIAAGDDLLGKEKYNDAKSKYNEAIALDNSQSYPVEKIAEIDKILADLEANNAKLAEYNAVIKEADQLLANSKLSESKQKYQEAIALDATDSYPSEQIEKIDALIAEQEANEAKNAQIAALIQEGSNLYGNTQLEDAKAKFEEVLSLDSGNATASDMIQKINSDIAALQNEEEREEQFQALKQEGMTLAANEEYTAAKKKLEEAIAIKEDGEVRSKIDEITGFLAAQEALNEKDAQYDAFIAEAQTREAASNYAAAIEKYRAASGVKPGESMPKEKIAELEGLLAGQEAQEAIDQEYRSFMDRGDELVVQENYLEAIKEYNKALGVKPGEKEPVDKAAEAERLEKAKVSDADTQYEKILTVAQEKIDAQDYDRATELLERAIGLKETDNRPKKMLATVVELKKVKAQYDALMKEGNDLAATSNYQEAKLKYEGALTKIPSATEPVRKIAEMDRLIADAASAEQKDALYRDYMSKGNVSQGTKNYQQALSQFQDALSVKPGDVTAQNKINEIQQILDDIANANAADIERKNKFDALIKDADGQFAVQSYLKAKGNYEEALRLNPASTYAKTQIEECERLERLIGIQEAEREYRKIIEAADKNFDTETYDKAANYYKRALTIKNDDPYPKRKLEEIDAILNPVTVSSADLEDLGDPFDNSIMDGMAALQEAQEARENLPARQINQTFKDIKDSETEMTSQKTSDHYDARQAVYDVQKQVIVDAGESDLNRQAIVDALRIAEKELADDERANITFEHAENLSDQGTMYRINAEVALEYDERESVYQENSDIMKSFNTALADDMTQRVQGNHGSNIDEDQRITDIHIAVSEQTNDDVEERALVEREVVKARNYAIDESAKNANSRYDIQLNNKVRVQDVYAAVGEQTVIDSEIPRDNNSDIAAIKLDVQEEEMLQASTEQSTVYKADREMAAVKRKVIADAQDFEEGARESNEVLKQGKRALADAETEKFNAEMDKYVKNKSAIDEETAVNGEIIQIAEDMHATKVAGVKMLDKKAHIQTQESMEGDEEERLLAKSKIEGVYANVSDNTVKEAQKTEDKAVEIRDIQKTQVAQDNANIIGNQEKHYDAQAKMNNVSNVPTAKTTVANSLGEEYPEGVSQESFSRSDKNGLMTTIITRRIVVIDGHADVFIRTQTINGITYSKNGKPTVAHVWNRETQDPSLERHF